jgi:hypothetical protein
MNEGRMSDQQVDAIGKMLSAVILGLLGAFFAYAYLAHFLLS